MKLSKIKVNPDNPRYIKEEDFESLKNSISTFEKMMKANPIKVDENMVILAGNQRYRAIVDLGYKDIPDDWIQVIDYFTEEEKQEYIIKDNAHYGLWDYDELGNRWEAEKLSQWGVNVPVPFDQMEHFDPNLSPEIDTKEITAEAIEKKAKELAEQMVKEQKTQEVICPYCGEEFEIS